EVNFWSCGYRRYCRRFCYAQEYTVGHHGCPRRYRCCALRY
uniref:Beta-defensin n=2 Tax=Lepisosteus oculatus TaxID=7918 RepID=W5M285_LEPOC